MTKLDVADEIIEKSLNNLNDAISGKISLDNFIYVVKTNYNNAFENIKRAVKSNNVITFMAQLYLNDLYQREISDNDKLMVSKNNINLLYGTALKLTDNMKIV